MGFGQGYGTTIAFASGFFGKIIDVNYDGPKRVSLDFTGTQSPNSREEFTPSSLVDAGELSVTIFHDGSVPPPIDNAPETVTVTWSDGKGVTCAGFLTEAPIDCPLKDMRKLTAKIKFTGKETWT